MSLRRIGITLGDVAGIGPEIVAKALASGKLDKRYRYEVIGDPGTTIRERAAHWVVAGAERCLRGDLAALVTGPIAKELLHQAGYPFVGQTELLAHLSRTKKFAMLLTNDQATPHPNLLPQGEKGRKLESGRSPLPLGGEDQGEGAGVLRVALVTTHAPIRDVPKLITGKKICDVVALTADFCRQLGIQKPRIAVTGLNPHAGEGGLLGTEERRIIAPAVKRVHAIGPCPADTVFYRAAHGEFDAVVAMYHDQGLAPFKLLAFDNGVNVTLGLPFVRTSPDHGTAPDIAGKGIARPDGMIAAINLAARLASSHR
jgi:4-hydroxythreonine-4-phosphate dehydrogenase